MPDDIHWGYKKNKKEYYSLYGNRNCENNQSNQNNTLDKWMKPQKKKKLEKRSVLFS